MGLIFDCKKWPEAKVGNRKHTFGIVWRFQEEYIIEITGSEEVIKQVDTCPNCGFWTTDDDESELISAWDHNSTKDDVDWMSTGVI